MDTGTTPSLAEQIAAAQAWWRDAGVDCDFSDEPIHWLAKDEPEPQAQALEPSRTAPAQPAAQRPAQREIDRSGWPAGLEDFAHWWMSDPTLDEGGLFPRIAPRGAAGAALMIVVQEPEESDRETLLSGRQGALLGSILAAMRIPADQVYLAAALPRHTPLADWGALAQAGHGHLLRHHMSLVAPRRVLLFGQHLLPLAGHVPAQTPAEFFQLELGGTATPTMAARDLASLLNRPRWRADFWRRWLEWTNGVGS